MDLRENLQKYSEENTRKYDEESILQLHLTPEEHKALSDCQYYSVVHRGLPCALISGASIHFLMKQRILKPNKILTAITAFSGFFMGILSYRQTCMNKLLALPNSTLKDRILAAQGIRPQVRVDFQSQDDQSSSWIDNLNSTEKAPMISSLDIEPYNQSQRMDDFSYTPSSSYTTFPPLQSNNDTSFTSYEELRRKNRESNAKRSEPGFSLPNTNNPTNLSPMGSQKSNENQNYPISNPKPAGDEFLP